MSLGGWSFAPTEAISDGAGGGSCKGIFEDVLIDFSSKCAMTAHVEDEAPRESARYIGNETRQVNAVDEDFD